MDVRKEPVMSAGRKSAGRAQALAMTEPSIVLYLAAVWLAFLGVVMTLMPFLVWVLGGGDWDAYVAQSGPALVAFPSVAVVFLVLAGWMIVDTARGRRAHRRRAREAAAVEGKELGFMPHVAREYNREGS
ncbi:hypothetical protein [Brevibacterium samyangense]